MPDLSGGPRTNGPLLRLHPGTRLAAAGLYALGPALMHNPVWALAACLPAFALLPFSGLDSGRAISRLLAANGFILFLWATVPWTYPGQPLFSLGPIQFSREGIALCLLVTCKANAIMAAFTALAGTIAPHRLGHALQRLGLHTKLCALVSFSCRYIDTLAREYATMRTAATLRGFRPGTSLRSYRTYAHLTGMLLVKSAERSQRVFEAMRCRGFDGTFHSLDNAPPTRRDTLFLVGAFLLCLLLLYADNFLPLRGLQ